jgi:hypothetical protein
MRGQSDRFGTDNKAMKYKGLDIAPTFAVDLKESAHAFYVLVR